MNAISKQMSLVSSIFENVNDVLKERGFKKADETLTRWESKYPSEGATVRRSIWNALRDNEGADAMAIYSAVTDTLNAGGVHYAHLATL